MTTLASKITVQRVSQSAVEQVDFNNLEFGKYLSDHMVVADYDKGKWSVPSVVPFGDIRVSPAMLSLHYGQAIFEGLKAFRMNDGSINVFRPHKHLDRLNKSLERFCMPAISEEMFLGSLEALLETDQQWVPHSDGASLYIRPLVFASEARLGVKVSDRYKFIIMTSPVGPYQAKPYRLKVEDKYVRTAEGGPGYAKCAGNYGGAFYPTRIAQQEGFDQVLWTDHKEHEYIDEVGMMNVFFVIQGKLITPQLSTAILDGVTRDSILTLARDMGKIPIEERKVSITEVKEALEKGTLSEAFGSGTAAVVAPIAVINIQGKDYSIPPVSENSFQLSVKQKLNNIRLGIEPDPYNWNYIIRS